jgi:hypothetical protein
MSTITSSSSITTDCDELHYDRIHNHSLPNSTVPSEEANSR